MCLTEELADEHIGRIYQDYNTPVPSFLLYEKQKQQHTFPACLRVIVRPRDVQVHMILLK